MEDSRLVKRWCSARWKEKTKRGRPKREWLDDVKEWCNEEIYILKRNARDRARAPQAGARGCTCTLWILHLSYLQNIIHARSLTESHCQTLLCRVKYDSRCWCSTGRH